MALKIKSVDLDRILQHAMECFPIEACGILVGKRVNNEVVVERVYRTRNVLNSSYAYQIDPEEQLKIFKLAEDEGLEVIGFYHSHPYHEPFWSKVDEERSKFWVGYSFLIVSPKTSSFRSYLRVKDGVIEERVIIA